MPPPPPVSIEVLLRHAAGLRSLARGLLRDEHAADDVVQETWIAALQEPPVHRAALGGWLRQVVRRRALQRRRGEGRRAAREARAGAGRGGNGDGDLARDLAPTGGDLADRGVLRDVIDAVLTLEEPYQTTVVERYFEDLPPREIAARRGVPVTTVKSQLARALAQLRARLDAETEGGRGQWGRALVVVTGIERSASPVTDGGAPNGGMGMEWKIVLGASAATALLVGSLQVGAVAGDGSAASDADGGRGGEAELARAGSALEPAAQEGRAGGDSTRTPVPESHRAETGLAPSLAPGEFAYALAGTVLDAHDLPVAGARVYLGPVLQPLSSGGRTDADGAFSFEWRGREPRMDVALVVRGGSTAWSGLLRVELEAGAPRNLRVRLQRDAEHLEAMHRLQSELAKLERLAAAGEKVAPSTELRAHLHGMEKAARGPRPVDFFDALGRTAPFGETGFRWPLADELRREREAHLVLEDQRAKEKKLRAEAEHRARLEQAQVHERKALVRRSPSGDRTLSVVVRDAGGAEVDDALVLAFGPERLWQAHSREAGIRFEGLDSSQALELRAGGGDLGLARTTVEPGERAVHWDAVLDRGEEVKGVLSGPDGAPLAGWVVEFVAGGETPWHDATTTADDGSFAIPNVGAAKGSLYLRPSSSWSLLPTRILPDVYAGPEPRELELSAADLGTGRVELGVAPLGEDLGSAVEVRMWQLSSGRGTWLTLDGETGRHASPEVPAGRYRVVVGTLESGYVPVATVEVGAGQTVDLGTLTPPRPGRISLAAALALPDGLTASWSLVRLGPVATLVAAGGADLEGALPSGEYALVTEGASFSAPALAFAIEPAGAAAPRPDLSGHRPVSLRLAQPAADVELLDGDGGVHPLGDLGAGTTRVFLAPGAWTVRARVGGEAVEHALGLPAEGGEPSVELGR